MPQLTAQDQEDLPGLAGGLYDSYLTDSISRTPGPSTSQISNVLVATATNSSSYAIIINGVASEYTSDASATTPEIAAGLLAAVQVNAFLTGVVVATAGAGDSVDITASVAGVSFVLAETDPGTDLTLSTPTANVKTGPISFGFGLAVSAALSEGIALPSATGFIFEGVAIARGKGRVKDSTVNPPVTGDAEYLESDTIPVLRKGRIWVIVEDTVTTASDVYLRHTANGALLVPGQFRSDADTANADQLVDARWFKGATAGNLAVLEINVP